MFRDARDYQFQVTLKAHKTVIGQLEKGELILKLGWKEWDEVRKNSVLSQTLQNLTTISNRKQNVTNNTKNSHASTSGFTSNANSTVMNTNNGGSSGTKSRPKALYLF